MNEPAKADVPRLWRVRLLAAAIWGYVLLVGYLVMAWHAHIFVPHRAHEQFLALKMLQANHRIVEGDIAEAGLMHPFLRASLTTRDDFNGRYVEDCVNDQDPVEIERTLSGPKITIPASKVMIWIPLGELPAADVATLDVGRKLDVCNLDGHESCGGDYDVEAIACTGKTTGAETCSAGVQVGSNYRSSLLTALETADKPPEPEGTPTPAPGAVGTRDRKVTTAAKTPKLPTIHVMIHRNAGVTPAPPAPSRCPVPAHTPAAPTR